MLETITRLETFPQLGKTSDIPDCRTDYFEIPLSIYLHAERGYHPDISRFSHQHAERTLKIWWVRKAKNPAPFGGLLHHQLPYAAAMKSPARRRFAFARLRYPTILQQCPKNYVSTANTNDPDHPTPCQPDIKVVTNPREIHHRHKITALRQAHQTSVRIATPSWPVRAGSFLFVMRSVLPVATTGLTIFLAKIRRQLRHAIS